MSKILNPNLTPEQNNILFEHGTERAFSDGGNCLHVSEEGNFYCINCNNLLFEATNKFESGTGWPSFDSPASVNSIITKTDSAFGMTRTEVLCGNCEGHLGHVFPDGPKPSGLRYCMNSLVLKFIPKSANNEQSIVLGGGCFWCLEAIFNHVQGVTTVISGYADSGENLNPAVPKKPEYNLVSRENGFVEVVKITFDPAQIDLATIYKIYLDTHDPSSEDKQGADEGIQYRSCIFVNDEAQEQVWNILLKELPADRENSIVTKVYYLNNLVTFVSAEDYHQKYYENNQNAGYCRAVIGPKLEKVKSKWSEIWK